MAQGVILTTRDFGLGVSPPDTGNRIFVVGPALGATFVSGITEPVTSKLASDFRAAFGVTKLSEYCASLVTVSGCAVTAIGFDAQTASANTNYFSTRLNNNATVAGTQLVVAFDAPPMDDLNIGVRFKNAGTTGTTGLRYDYTLDGGQTYSAEKALGTSLSIPLLPYAQSLVFETGKAIAADTWQVAASFSPVGAANAIAAVKACIALRTPGDAILVASNETNATVTTMTVDVLAGEAKNRNMDLITETRDIKRDGSESVATWGAAVIAQAQATQSRIWSPNPGHYYAVGGFADSPVQRRPLSLFLAQRYLLNNVQTDPARVSAGRNSVLSSFSSLTAPDKLSACMKPPGAANDPEYLHDEEVTPLFDELRISSASRQVGPNEFYFYNARLASLPGSDFDLTQISRVVHKARNAAYGGLVVYRHQEVFVNDEGHISDEDADAIDARMNQILFNSVVASGNCSAAVFVLNRTDDIIATKEIGGYIDIRPRGYLKTIRVYIGLVNPAVAVAA